MSDGGLWKQRELDAVQAALAVLDVKGHIILLNEYGAALLGKPRAGADVDG